MNAQLDRLALHIGRDLPLVIGGIAQALVGDADAAEPDGELVAIGLFAATTLPALAAEPVKMVDTKMGKIMATEKGMTLYTFDKDAQGKSNCDKDCLKKWPAFHAADQAKAEGEWSLVQDANGKKIWAYGGKPLYTFAGDKKAGEMNGDGIGNVWHVAK